jgi:hypothetical protein
MAENPMRFALDDGEVVVEGTIGNRSQTGNGGVAERLTVVTLPAGYRPAEDLDFEVESESGSTTVTVQTNGELLADPTVGWIRLDGIRLPAA